MDDTRSKRPRCDAPAGVAALGVFPGISANTIQRVIGRVRENPGCLSTGPQGYTWIVRKGKDKLRKELEIIIDVPLKKGGTFSWGMFDPAGLLQHYCKESPEYADRISRAWQRYPAGRWRLILYEDEIQPGNAFLSKKKLHAWYFSFREFDVEIYDENSWLCFAVLQSSIVPSVQGGFSCVSKLVHQALFTRKGQMQMQMSGACHQHGHTRSAYCIMARSSKRSRSTTSSPTHFKS